VKLLRPKLLRSSYNLPAKAIKFLSIPGEIWLTTQEMASLLDISVQLICQHRPVLFASDQFVRRRNETPQDRAFIWNAQTVINRIIDLRKTFPEHLAGGLQTHEQIQAYDQTQQPSIGESGIVLDVNTVEKEEPAEVCPQPPSQGKPAPAKSIPAEPSQSASSSLTHAEVMRTFEVATRFGGSFMKAIALAGLHADPDNVGKILRTWPSIKQQYGPGTPFYEEEA